MPEENRKKVRTIGVNFPYDNDGDFTYEALQLAKEQQDRSLSRIVYRILRDHFANNVDNDFAFEVERRLSVSD